MNYYYFEIHFNICENKHFSENNNVSFSQLNINILFRNTISITVQVFDRGFPNDEVP